MEVFRAGRNDEVGAPMTAKGSAADVTDSKLFVSSFARVLAKDTVFGFYCAFVLSIACGADDRLNVFPTGSFKMGPGIYTGEICICIVAPNGKGYGDGGRRSAVYAERRCIDLVVIFAFIRHEFASGGVPVTLFAWFIPHQTGRAVPFLGFVSGGAGNVVKTGYTGLKVSRLTGAESDACSGVINRSCRRRGGVASWRPIFASLRDVIPN